MILLSFTITAPIGTSSFKNALFASFKAAFMNFLSITSPKIKATTHDRATLWLLRSRPDTVHRFPSRKTQTSTPLTKGSLTDKSPPCNITPTIADCRYKAPLPPRLYGNFMTVSRVFSITVLFFFVNQLLIFLFFA